MTKNDIISRLKQDCSLAEAILDDAIDLFVRFKPASESAVLKQAIGADFNSFEDKDFVEIISAAKNLLNSNRDCRKA